MNNGALNQSPGSVLSRREACKYLKVGLSKLDQLCREEGLPFIKLGRRIILKTDAVDCWLVERTSANERKAD